MSAPLDWAALGGDLEGDEWVFSGVGDEGFVGRVAGDGEWFVQLDAGEPSDHFDTEADAYQFVAEMQRLGRFVAELRELAGT